MAMSFLDGTEPANDERTVVAQALRAVGGAGQQHVGHGGVPLVRQASEIVPRHELQVQQRDRLGRFRCRCDRSNLAERTS